MRPEAGTIIPKLLTTVQQARKSVSQHSPRPCSVAFGPLRANQRLLAFLRLFVMTAYFLRSNKVYEMVLFVIRFLTDIGNRVRSNSSRRQNSDIYTVILREWRARKEQTWWKLMKFTLPAECPPKSMISPTL